MKKGFRYIKTNLIVKNSFWGFHFDITEGRFHFELLRYPNEFEYRFLNSYYWDTSFFSLSSILLFEFQDESENYPQILAIVIQWQLLIKMEKQLFMDNISNCWFRYLKNSQIKETLKRNWMKKFKIMRVYQTKRSRTSKSDTENPESFQFVK